METESFKSFLSRKKRAYAMMFPYLQHPQIVAKLKRIWTKQKANSSSGNCKGESALSCLQQAPAKLSLKGMSENPPLSKQASVFDFDQENVPPPLNTIRAPCPKATQPKACPIPAKTASPLRVSALKCSKTHPLPTVAIPNGVMKESSKHSPLHSHYLRSSSKRQNKSPTLAAPQALNRSCSNSNHGVLVSNTAKHPLEDSLTAENSPPTSLAKNMQDLHVCSEGSVVHAAAPTRHVHWQSPGSTTVHQYTPAPSLSRGPEDPSIAMCMEVSNEGSITAECPTDCTATCKEASSDLDGSIGSEVVVECSTDRLEVPTASTSLCLPATFHNNKIQRRVNQRRRFEGRICHNLYTTIGSTSHQNDLSRPSSLPCCCNITGIHSSLELANNRSPLLEEVFPSNSDEVEPCKGDLQKATIHVACGRVNTRYEQLHHKGGSLTKSSVLLNREQRNENLKTIDMSESLPDVLTSHTCYNRSPLELNSSTCSLPSTSQTKATTHKRRRVLCEIQASTRMTRSKTAAFRKVAMVERGNDSSSSTYNDSLLEESLNGANSSRNGDHEFDLSLEPCLKKSRLSPSTDEVMEYVESSTAQDSTIIPVDIPGAAAAAETVNSVAVHLVAVHSPTELPGTEAARSGHFQPLPVESAYPEPLMAHSQVGQAALLADRKPPSTDGFMCDLFSPLPPRGRKIVDAYSFCLTGTTGDSATERRVFQSASAAEGEGNFYTMFSNDSDIFM